MQKNNKLYLPDFHKLKVYQKTMDLVDSIMVLKHRLPFKEQSKIWRLVTSIPARIVYGNNQLYLKQKTHSMKMANYSAKKTIEWLEYALNKGILDQQDFGELTESTIEICKMLSGMMKKEQQK